MFAFLGKILKKNWVLICILGYAALILFYNASYVDFLGDNSHYSTRSVGLVDMMFSDKQTTPLQWFDSYPWWANLSFHDHPILLFVIQHIFLSIHESILFAKLPYILFSLGTIIVVYFWMKQEYGSHAGLWSAGFLSVNSLFICTARAGFMEAGVVFFVALSVYFFFKFLKNQQFWWQFGLVFGLCLISKYNTFFLIPTFGLYLLLSHRYILKNKKLYWSLLFTFVVASPSIIYNIMMYKTTGHLDYQFSRLFGLSSPWSAPDVGTFFANPIEIFLYLGKNVSFIYLAVAVCGLFYGFAQRKMKFVGIALLFLTIQFMFMGAGAYHMNIYNVFLAPAAAFGIISFFSICKKNKYFFLVRITAGLCMIYFAFFVYNSNILVHKIVPMVTGVTVSVSQNENMGLYQLSRYLDMIFKSENIQPVLDGYSQLKKKKKSLKRFASPVILTKKDTSESVRSFDTMIIYDSNINWFAEVWYFKRLRFYHNLPILSTREFARFVNDITIKKVFFIKALEGAYREADNNYDGLSEVIEKSIEMQGIEPDVISAIDGTPVFNIYEIVL